MIYLASAYSHPDPLIMKTRFLLAEEVTAELLRRRQVVFSPIVHSHELAIKYNLPTDFAFWQNYCIGMLRLASSMLVLSHNRDDAWKASKGVQEEIKIANTIGIPVCGVNLYGDPVVLEF